MPFIDRKSIFAEQKWESWEWQLEHIVTDINAIEKALRIQLSAKYKKQLSKTIKSFPMRITPYYLSLIDTKDYLNDPIFKQSVPCIDELTLEKYELKDPLGEDRDSPAPGITHRYPDRVLFHVSNLCAMYCRHCTRKRKVGDIDQILSKEDLLGGIKYVRETPAIRDVLLSGGDPFLLPDHLIDWLLSELYQIPHVEIVRIGTRTPVVLPQRITSDLLQILKKYKPLWINTHFNHPREITRTAQKALYSLIDAGIPLGNQTVLLAGVNDCPRIMKRLMHKLVKNRVRPYYLYQCDLSEGLSHFRTPISKGVEIMENLIGHTSGFAVPSYVVDAPDGGGKIPVMPQYVISNAPYKTVLRNYEGVVTVYEEPHEYKNNICDNNCENCDLNLVKDEQEIEATGVAKLLCDYDDSFSLVPESNDRIFRRENEVDQVITVGKSLLQHGRMSDRVYLMSLDNEDMPSILKEIEGIANKEKYGKITAKVPEKWKKVFLKNGYKVEATIPKFFNLTENGYFLAKFLDKSRSKKTNISLVKHVLEKALLKEIQQTPPKIPENYLVRKCVATDVEMMAELYSDTFMTYPFPVDDPQYILDSMGEKTKYLGVWNEKEQLISLASFETYSKHDFVEMTDFATLPSYQGKGLGSILLHEMESLAKLAGFSLAYTSARATIYSINCIFSSRGYTFAGTLINNTSIGGRIENMNIWYKFL